LGVFLFLSAANAVKRKVKIWMYDSEPGLMRTGIQKDFENGLRAGRMSFLMK